MSFFLRVRKGDNDRKRLPLAKNNQWNFGSCPLNPDTDNDRTL